MDLSIGVIGAGDIGTDHARRLSTRVRGARVHAVFDVEPGRAQAIAAELGAVAHKGAQDVIDDPAVEAVLIAAPGPVHAQLALACISARKPVFCEKPLAPTVSECLKVMEAESATSSRLVQVGFMRRYDEGYRRLKRAVEDGSIGAALLAHCVHRNAKSPLSTTSEMLLTESVVHEIDAARWLLSDELVAVRVLTPAKSPLAPQHLRDPQLVLLESASSVLVEVEVFVNCQYGYDVRCEVVGSVGTASLELPSTGARTTAGARCQPVPGEWKERFGGAYTEELQHWTDGALAGTISGPSSYDGYAAAAVAEACVRSLGTGEREEVILQARPAIYPRP